MGATPADEPTQALVEAAVSRLASNLIEAGCSKDDLAVALLAAGAAVAAWTEDPETFSQALEGRAEQIREEARRAQWRPT